MKMPAIVCLSLFALLCSLARAQNIASPTLKLLQGIGIDQHLRTRIPPDLTFRDETGATVQLADLERGKPIVLVLVQYGCPSLCTVELNGMLSTFKVIPQNIGDQYDVWAISFDPNESSKLAAEKKSDYLHSYTHTRPDAVHASEGWHFLTGDAPQIQKLTEAVGFHYRWDEHTRQFVHPAGLMILTPDGTISRYFFGIDFEPTDLRLSLAEASGGKIGALTDQILLFCYHYDPSTGKYTFAVGNALRVGGVLTVLLLAGAMGMLWRTINAAPGGF